jgi:hypothetical protein
MNEGFNAELLSAAIALPLREEQDMATLEISRNLILRLNNQPLAVRFLLGAGCLITAAAMFSAPVEADPHDDDFIDALSHAGVEYGEPGNAMAVGQSICPMIAQPGGSFAAAASGVAQRGMSPQLAQMFTTIAIQTYCPEEMANIMGGNVSGLQQLPGVPGMPGMQGVPGMPGMVPGI